ncbi:MAG: hypothetical protein WD851_21670 [Pirellulales bacterium]
MTRVVTCPQCAAQLSVPETMAAGSQASCPYCDARFALNDEAVRALRSVTLVESPAEASAAEVPFSSQATVPGLTEMPTLSTLFERFRDIPRSETNDDSGNADETQELADTVVSGTSNETHDPFDFDTGELGIERQANIDYQPDALEHKDAVIAASAPDPAGRAFVADVVSVSQAQKRRSRGSGSLVRQLVGVVGGGALGLMLGYFALLWWRGPDGDLLGVADRIPRAILPAAFDEAGDHGELASDEPAPSPEPQSDVERATFESSIPSPTESLDVAEPRPLTPEGAKPLVVNATVQDAPSYTQEQLNAAIALAATARERLVTGALNDAAAKRTKGESYVQLCQIAETLTFLADGDAQALADSQVSGRQFFAELLQDPTARDEIAQIAVRWIGYPKRPHGGVFFAGKVLSSQQSGSAHEVQLELVDGATVTVLTPEPSPLDGTVGVVGSILEQPATRITGYSGTAERAVWSRLMFPLD